MSFRSPSMPLRSSIPVRATVIVLTIACLVCSVPVWFSWRQHHREQKRQAAMLVTVQQARIILEAIEHYKQEQHATPLSLEALVPSYLSQLPNAGPLAKDGWHYKHHDEAQEQAGGWALFVWVRDEYSPNLLGFGDAFVFHPSGNYRRSAYGGILLTSDKWAYYVE